MIALDTHEPTGFLATKHIQFIYVADLQFAIAHIERHRINLLLKEPLIKLCTAVLWPKFSSAAL